MIVLYEQKYPAIVKGLINSTDLNEIIKRSLDFDNPVSKLSKLNKENRPDLKQFIVMEVVTPILKHYNSTAINESNINNVIELIVKAGYYITLDDLIVFKNNWVLGKYEIKYKFDITDFQESFYCYLDDRAEKLAKYHQNKGREAVKIECNKNTEKVKELLNVLAKPKEKLPALEDNKELRDKLMTIHKEFKDLLSEQGREFEVGKQFVLIEGKEMDINDYLKYKENGK
jgi:hypothetical protein